TGNRLQAVDGDIAFSAQHPVNRGLADACSCTNFSLAGKLAVVAHPQLKVTGNNIANFGLFLCRLRTGGQGHHVVAVKPEFRFIGGDLYLAGHAVTNAFMVLVCRRLKPTADHVGINIQPLGKTYLAAVKITVNDVAEVLAADVVNAFHSVLHSPLNCLLPVFKTKLPRVV
ncbi:hypothetical protein SEVCU121_0071, partial [Staphylococcus warneri VCU121]